MRVNNTCRSAYQASTSVWAAFLKIFTLFEEAAHELDILIHTVLGRVSSQHEPLRYWLSEYVERLQTVSRLTEEANKLFEHADFLDSLTSWNLLTSDADLEGPEEDSSNLSMETSWLSEEKRNKLDKQWRNW